MTADQKVVRSAVAMCMSALAMMPIASQAQGAADSWQWKASIYAWLPTIDGSTHFPSGGSGPTIDIDASNILDALKFTFMGTLDVRKGDWGLFTDVLYLDVGSTKSATRDFAIGQVGVPAGVTGNLSYDLKSWVWTIAGEYGISNTPQNSTELLAGARMVYLKQTLDWGLSGSIAGTGLPGRSGRSQIDATNWDAIVGLKGVARLSADGRWVLPYYLDIGTGQSKFTWQALGGVGYSFDWGTTTLAWRYLDYQFKSSAPMENINFSGPFLGVAFRW